LTLPQQFRQLGDIGRDPARFVALSRLKEPDAHTSKSSLATSWLLK
jgi:hypothetical protein